MGCFSVTELFIFIIHRRALFKQSLLRIVHVRPSVQPWSPNLSPSMFLELYGGTDLSFLSNTTNPSNTTDSSDPSLVTPYDSTEH